MSEQALASAVESPAPTGNAWTQTRALFFDAYRDLQSRKLFWLTLILSLLIAGVFAVVGITPDGITIVGRTLPIPAFNSNLIKPPDFFKFLFTNFAIPVWLGFLSAVLGLITVAGMFPDAISSGSIDLYLSRPIGRLRLFLTKYAFGLLFTAIQVLAFCTVSFLVIGFRGGAWELGIFLAVPIVTLFFSYLYCVCVFIGIVTRSALASILITALFWGFLFVIHAADLGLTGFTLGADERVDAQKRGMAGSEGLFARNDALPPEQRGDMSAFEFQREKQKERLAEATQLANTLHWWQNLVYSIKTPLPKTNETISLMSRWLVRPGALDAVQERERELQAERRERMRQRREAMGRGESPPPATSPTTRSSLLRLFSSTAPSRPPTTAAVMPPPPSPNAEMNPDEVDQKLAEELRSRDLPWVLGTSLGFEAVVLGLGAWIFCRRDF